MLGSYFVIITFMKRIPLCILISEIWPSTPEKVRENARLTAISPFVETDHHFYGQSPTFTIARRALVSYWRKYVHNH